MDDYIALHTYDYKLSFLSSDKRTPRVTCKGLVWEKLNAYESRDPRVSRSPKKTITKYTILKRKTRNVGQKMGRKMGVMNFISV